MLFAPTVATSPSTIISSLDSPCLKASLRIVFIISFFSLISLGSPFSDNGRRINIAPYFFAAGISLSNLAGSSETEFINALPGYMRSAASTTSGWLESIESGRLLTIDSSLTVLSIISFSSIPFMPILTSSIDAPISSCDSAISATRSRHPCLSSSWSAFLPVGLILSPIIRKFPSSPISSTFLSLESARLLTLPFLPVNETLSFNPFSLIRLSIAFI